MLPETCSFRRGRPEHKKEDDQDSDLDVGADSDCSKVEHVPLERIKSPVGDAVSPYGSNSSAAAGSSPQAPSKLSERFKHSMRSMLKAECQELMKPVNEEHPATPKSSTSRSSFSKRPSFERSRRGSAPAMSKELSEAVLPKAYGVV
jgi:hypothetical protein